ncbi:hypothetical protein BOX15_Mlig006846g1 [Macrostomum lignano]|uniref:MAGUK p55 subfamily member 5 n=1 Tax=Macrostomum lignano TaxID=282301 RepID=A0A267DS31_9PLAT|nr:hypothetical protein BOX15_Mlig006846g1 [Macrostomum lignano]
MADLDTDSSSSGGWSNSGGEAEAPAAAAAEAAVAVAVATAAAESASSSSNADPEEALAVAAAAESEADSSEEDEGNPFDAIREGLDRLAGSEAERQFVADFVSSDAVALLCDLTEFLDTELQTFRLSDQFKASVAGLSELVAEAIESIDAERLSGEFQPDVSELTSLLSSMKLSSFLASMAEVAKGEYEPELGELPEDFFDEYSSGSEDSNSVDSSDRESFRVPSNSAAAASAASPLVAGGVNGDAPDTTRSRPSGKQVSYIGLPPEQPQPPPQQRHSSVQLRNPSGLGGASNSAYRHSNLVERQVSINKDPSEPLGFTVAREYVAQYDKQMIMVERVMMDGPIDREGVFQVGDLITEINEQPLESPEALQRMLRQLSGNVTFTVLTPAFKSVRSDHSTVYLRACFEYRPDFDTLLPTRDLGLRFVCGDILQVVNQEDPNYWQARLVGKPGKTKLIPSQQLEEKRKAFIPVRKDAQARQASAASCAPLAAGKQPGKGRVKKTIFSAETAAEFDRAEIWTYEEVVMCPPEPLTCLVLVGPPGIGRRTVKKWLCQRLPDRFAEVKPVSSNSRRRDGAAHASKEAMRKAIAAGEFLEYGDFQGELIGVRLADIEAVSRPRLQEDDGEEERLTAVVDCLCPSIKLLRSGRFKPYVVFMAAPAVEIQQVLQDKGRSQGVLSRTRTQEEMQRAVNKSIRMERLYRPLFDLAVLCDNLESVYQKIVTCVESVEANGRWLPASWVNDMEDQPTA